MYFITLIYGTKAKPICTAIGQSSKIFKVRLHSNKAKLENFETQFAPRLGQAQSFETQFVPH